MLLNVKRSLRTNVCGRKNLPSDRDLTLQEAYILERERDLKPWTFLWPPTTIRETNKENITH